MLILKAIDPAGNTTAHYLDKPELIIGRSPDADLSIDDDYASRLHARIFIRQGIPYVEDLQSINGTYLNGHPLLGPSPVVAGDKLQISGYIIAFSEKGSVGLAIDNRDRTLVDARQILSEAISFSDTAPIEAKDDLPRYIRYLRLIVDINGVLDSTDTLEGLIDSSTETLFQYFHPDQVAIFLMRDDGKPYEAGKRSVAEFESETLSSKSITEITMKEQRAVLIRDIRKHVLLSKKNSLNDLRSLVAVPLLEESRAIGMIILLSRRTPNWFMLDDMRLIMLAGSSISRQIRNLRLIAERSKQKREMELARCIQTRLLSHNVPEIGGYELYCHNRPSQIVSGDYFNIIKPFPDKSHITLLSIVDVSGKGISAALLTASLEASAAGLIKHERELNTLCRELSELVFSRTSTEKYATGIFLALDSQIHTIKYCNAGHPPGFILRTAPDIEFLDSSGPPIGLIECGDFKQKQTELGLGDLVVLYTDGVTETKSSKESEEFGVDRLVRVCSTARFADLEKIALRIEEDVSRFSEGRPNGDDLTILLLRRVD